MNATQAATVESLLRKPKEGLFEISTTAHLEERTNSLYWLVPNMSSIEGFHFAPISVHYTQTVYSQYVSNDSNRPTVHCFPIRFPTEDLGCYVAWGATRCAQLITNFIIGNL